MTLDYSNNLGEVSISNDVLANIIGISVLDFKEVVGMSSKKIQDGFAELLKKENFKKGINIRNEDDGQHVDIYVILRYGTKIPDISLNIQKKVSEDLKIMTNIDVQSVNIFVEGIRLVEEKTQGEE